MVRARVSAPAVSSKKEGRSGAARTGRRRSDGQVNLRYLPVPRPPWERTAPERVGFRAASGQALDRVHRHPDEEVRRIFLAMFEQLLE